MPESTIPALLGRYRPQHVIGRGGEASIFRATDELLGREVAIKLYRSAGEEEMAQYRTEQAALARLSHHGIVSLIDAGIDYSSPKDPRPFLIRPRAGLPAGGDGARRPIPCPAGPAMDHTPGGTGRPPGRASA